MDRTTAVTLPPLIVLSGEDLATLVPFDEYVDAVSDAFRMHAQGCAMHPPPMHIPCEGGVSRQSQPASDRPERHGVQGERQFSRHPAQALDIAWDVITTRVAAWVERIGAK